MARFGSSRYYSNPRKNVSVGGRRGGIFRRQLTGTVLTVNRPRLPFGAPPAATAPGTVTINGSVVLAEGDATSTQVVIPVPAGAALGEYLLAHVTHSSPSGATVPAIATPAGWTLIDQIAGVGSGSPATALFYRAVVASEPASYTFATNPSAGRVTGIMARLAGVHSTTQLDTAAVTAATSATGSTVVVPSITTVTNGALVAYGVTVNAATAADIVAPPEVTELAKATGTGRRAGLYSEARPTAGATGTRTFTQTTTNLQWAAVGVAFRPAPSTGGGQAIDRSAVSTADATDSVSRTLDAQRTESSSAGATDTVSRSLDANRSQVSTADATDSATRTLDANRSASSAAGAVDSVSTSLAANRSQSSAAGAVDAHTWSMASARSVSSDAGASDTASRSLDANRGASSDAGATDSVTWSMFSPRSLAFTAAGGTAGAAVTIADTGSGSALDQVSQSTGSVTYEADHPARGNLGVRCAVGATTGTPYVGWTAASTGGVNAHTTTRLYGWIPAYATGFTNLVRVANGGTQVGRLQLSAAGALRYWSDAAAASLGITAWSLPVGELFRLEMQVEHAAAGTVDLRLFTGANVHGNVPDQTLSLSGNTGGGVDGVQYGIASGNSIASYTIYLDEIAWSNTTDWIGPAAVQGLSVQASATSTAGATDAVTRTLDAQRTVADTAGATDSHSWSAEYGRSVSSAAGATDTASASLAAQRSQSSSAGATDAVSRSLDAVRTVSSDAGASDTASTSLAAVRSAVSVAGATDEVTRAVDYVRYASSDAGAADQVTAGLDYVRSASSDAGAVDTASAVRNVVRTASSTADARDEINISSAGSTSLSATSAAGATDSVAVIRDVVRYASSGAGATDEVTAVRDVVRSASSSAGAVDSASVSTAVGIDRTATSTAGATDSVTVQLDSVRGAVSTAGATDNVTWEMARVITRYASSDAGATDEVAAVRDVHRTAASDAGASDTVTAARGAVITVADRAGATDSVTWSMTTFLGAYVVDYGEPRPQTTGRDGPVRRARTRRTGLRISTTDGGLRYGSTRERE
jgi:hypothetical protein